MHARSSTILVAAWLICTVSSGSAQSRSAADSALDRSIGHWVAPGVSFQSGNTAHPFAVDLKRADSRVLGDRRQPCLAAYYGQRGRRPSYVAVDALVRCRCWSSQSNAVSTKCSALLLRRRPRTTSWYANGGSSRLACSSTSGDSRSWASASMSLARTSGKPCFLAALSSGILAQSGLGFWPIGMGASDRNVAA